MDFVHHFPVPSITFGVFDARLLYREIRLTPLNEPIVEALEGFLERYDPLFLEDYNADK